MKSKGGFASSTLPNYWNIVAMFEITREIDITADICPMTFVRTRLALDKMSVGETLLVKLKGEEPKQNVPRTAMVLGHEVLSLETGAAGVTHVLIRRGK